VVEFPSGTLTFLFTDLQGSTANWEANPDVRREAVARHDELLAETVVSNHGQVVKTACDGLVAVFGNAGDGVAGPLACQPTLATEDWPTVIKARMGLYTGSRHIRLSGG
jgi:class 3 adenylate cyclase